MDTSSLDSGSRFLASTLHEIRTPIQTIISTLELLEETPLNKEQMEYIRQLSFSSNVLLQLANNVLDFTKIRAGEMKIEHIPFDPVELTEQVVNLICIDAFAKGLDVVTDLDWLMPQKILGDPIRIQQILLNLIKNAVKFTQEGHITICLKKVDQSLLFEVKDTGIGIPQEKRQHVFKEFYQVDESTTRKYGGTGLGLSICKNLTEILGGKIGVAENEGQGSVFWFTIPYETEEENSFWKAPQMGKESRAIILTPNEEAAKSLHKKCTLVGFANITMAQDSDDAISKIRDEENKGSPYTIAFIDNRFAQAFTDCKTRFTTPLCMIIPEGKTFRSIPEIFTEHIYKPIKRHQLVELVTHLSGNKTAAETSEPNKEESLCAEGLSILIAEDHPMNRTLLQTILEKFGATVFLSENGEEAMDVALSHDEVKLIFMDMQMPVKNGIDATAELRSRNYNGVIIACTANNDKADFDAYLQIGVNDILPKPYKKTDVRNIIEKWKKILTSPNANKILAQKNVSQLAQRIWNIDDFMDTTENDRILAITLIGDYIAQTEHLLTQLQTELAKAEPDFKNIKDIAHALKGSSVGISATCLFEHGKEMEAAAEKQDKTAVETERVGFMIDFIQLKKLTELWVSSL